jgi:hypothetical protein
MFAHKPVLLTFGPMCHSLYGENPTFPQEYNFKTLAPVQRCISRPEQELWNHPASARGPCRGSRFPAWGWRPHNYSHPIFLSILEKKLLHRRWRCGKNKLECVTLVSFFKPITQRRAALLHLPEKTCNDKHSSLFAAASVTRKKNYIFHCHLVSVLFE